MPGSLFMHGDTPSNPGDTPSDPGDIPSDPTLHLQERSGKAKEAGELFVTKG